MRCEWPEVTRCLCCIPLRIGLLSMGYIKLIINIVAIMAIIATLVRNYLYNSTFSMVITVLILLFFAIDIPFHVILILGAHQKNHRTVRIYYRYDVTAFAINIIISLIYTGYLFVLVYKNLPNDSFSYHIMYLVYIAIVTLSAISLNLGVHFYVLVLVRSEVKKLKNNTQFQFTNQMESVCTGTIEFGNKSISLQNDTETDTLNNIKQNIEDNHCLN